jgi:RNA polymerase sigma-54 factor
MRPALQLKIGAQLALTPNLKQAIKLLTLNQLELCAELAKIAESNPVLELDEPNAGEQDGDLEDSQRLYDMESAPEPASHDSSSAESAENMQHAEDGADFGAEDLPEAVADDAGADLDVDVADLRDWGDGTDGRSKDDNAEREEQYFDESETSLAEHLRAQLALLPFSPREYAIAQVLIDAADDDGFIRDGIDQQILALRPEHHVSEPEVETVRRRLSWLDPIGVLCRSLVECLSVQLQAIKHPRRTLALDLVALGPESLARIDREKVARQFEVEVHELSEALALVRRLDPRPGARFNVRRIEYIVPDVRVFKADGQWQVKLNREILPRVRINSTYVDMVGRCKRDDDQFLRTQIADAKQLLKSLVQREDSVLRVAQAIVKEQSRFFDHGLEYLKPLILRDISEQVGLHESTVSRITSHKYMHTPRGLLEFKHFFSSGVSTRDGGEASATSIQEMIRRLIDTEDREKPMSDSALGEILKARGVMVARRTVAKYREALGIPSSTDRVQR